MKIFGDKNRFLRVFFHKRVSIFIISLIFCQKSVRAGGGQAHQNRPRGARSFGHPPPADYAEQAGLTGPNLLDLVPLGQLSTKPPIGPGHGVY